MRRIVEILKIFQSSLEFVFLPYLAEKFLLNIRTLQNDILKINRLLATVSNCKIITRKDQLIIIGNNPKTAITDLLKKLMKKTEYDSLVKSYQLIFYHAWENQPLTSVKLLNFTNNMFYDLKQEINLINNIFNYYHLNLKFKFKTKQGWFLIGSESDLRLITTNILIKQGNSPLYPNNYLNSSLLKLQDQLTKILLNNNFYDYYLEEIVCFLMIVIKRIKLNKLLDSYPQPLILKLLNPDELIDKNFIKLTKIIMQEFNLEFNTYEVIYFKSLMLLNQKRLNNDFIFNLIQSLNNFINQLVFKEYYLFFAIEKFKTTLNEFLNENLLKFLFNFYQDFDFNFINDCYLLRNSCWYGWEVVNIIVFALKKFNINIKFQLFINDYFLLMFNNFYLEIKEKNWKVPLYYQPSNSFSSESKKIVLFILNNYKNIFLKFLNISNSYYKLNFLNKNYAIMIDYEFNDLLPSAKFFLINNRQSNQNLKQNLDFTMKKMLIDKIRSSILVFQLYFNQKFSNIKNVLTYLQEALIRKFKIDSVNFQLKDGFINTSYLLNKILIVHKLVTKNNVSLPIILIYLKNPLILNKKFPISFIFVLINNSDTLYQYQGLISYLDINKNKFNVQVNSVMNVYQIINNFNFIT